MSRLLDLLQKEASLMDSARAKAVELGEQAKAKAGKGLAAAKEVAKANPKAVKAGLGGAVAGAAALGTLFSRKAPSAMDKGLSVVKKNPRAAALAAALGLTGGALVAKQASEQDDRLEFAKVAAQELAEDCLAKLAFAEQLYNEATYIDQAYVKQASEVKEIDSDGSALEAFLEELEASEQSEEE